MLAGKVQAGAEEETEVAGGNRKSLRAAVGGGLGGASLLLSCAEKPVFQGLWLSIWGRHDSTLLKLKMQKLVPLLPIHLEAASAREHWSHGIIVRAKNAAT